MDYIKGLVSVVIPTYRRSDMLVRAIDSVVRQTYTNIEVIVVNDNDMDDEFSVKLYNNLERYTSDSRVRVVEQDHHKNGAVARNVGIINAQGEYLAFLDDDDWWEPIKIEHQIYALETLDNSWGGVSCLMKHYRNGKLVYVSVPYKDGMVMKNVISRTIGIGTGSLLMRRSAVDDTGYFDESLFRHQDIQFFGFFCNKYKIKLLKEYLYNYDLGDAQNRPNTPQKIDKLKNDYYKSISSLIEKMPQNDLNIFYSLHNFEIGLVYIRNNQLIKGIRKCISVIAFPKAAVLITKRIIERIKGQRFCHYYERKYSAYRK